jgi:hypothetical protein
VQTDRTIPNSNPDIVISDHENMSIYVKRCCKYGDRNVIKKEAETILKYEDLTLAIQRMWSVKTKVIPPIIVENETISKSFRKYT